MTWFPEWITYHARLEHLHRSGVQLPERPPPLSITGIKLRPPWNPSKHHEGADHFELKNQKSWWNGSLWEARHSKLAVRIARDIGMVYFIVQYRRAGLCYCISCVHSINRLLTPFFFWHWFFMVLFFCGTGFFFTVLFWY